MKGREVMCDRWLCTIECRPSTVSSLGLFGLFGLSCVQLFNTLLWIFTMLPMVDGPTKATMSGFQSRWFALVWSTWDLAGAEWVGGGCEGACGGWLLGCCAGPALGSGLLMLAVYTCRIHAEHLRSRDLQGVIGAVCSCFCGLRCIHVSHCRPLTYLIREVQYIHRIP